MQTQSYHTFRKRMHNFAKNRKFPLRVMIELTYRCNFNCKHCYLPDSYKTNAEMTTGEIYAILDELADIGCFYAGFTGGEPFMRNDIIDILTYARGKGFEVIIYTNGSLINKHIAEVLSALRLNKVDITIPAISDEPFDKIVGVSGMRGRVFKAIHLLYNHAVSLGFKTCVLKDNESQIKDIQNFTHSLGALHRLDNMLSRRLDGSKEPFLYRSSFKKQTIDYKLQATGIDNHAFNIKHNTTNKSLFACGVGETQVAITPQGELKPCLMIDNPRFNIFNAESKKQSSGSTPKKSNLKEAWIQLKQFIASIKPDEDYRCDTCYVRDYCKWCPARAWLYNKSFTACDPECKRFAESQRIKAEKIAFS